MALSIDATKLMFYEVYVIPLPALISIGLLLTDIKPIQTTAIKLASVHIGFGKALTITISQLFLFLSCTRFAAQCLHVTHAQSKLTHYREGLLSKTALVVTPEVEDRLKANVWRSERNFWICLLGVGGWIVFIRICQVLQKLWFRIDSQKKTSHHSPPSPISSKSAASSTSIPSTDTSLSDDKRSTKMESKPTSNKTIRNRH